MSVLIDCDPGVDDALALALALSSPELDVRAITTVFGNVPLKWSYRNARRVVSWLREWSAFPSSSPPVYPGAVQPLRPKKINRQVSYAIHGADGLGDLFRRRKPPYSQPGSGEMASTVMLTLAHELRKALTIIAIGPLTNLAIAIRENRKVMAGVGRIVIMGGNVQMPGNVTPAAEFNVHCDPDAAQVVFHCGAPVTMVGLDVTRRAVLPSQAIQGGGAFRRAVRDLVRPYTAFAKRRRALDGTTLHDPLAVGVAIKPDLVCCEKRSVSVDCGEGPARGMTVVDIRPDAAISHKGTKVDVALKVDERRFLRFFLRRMESYRGWF